MAAPVAPPREPDPEAPVDAAGRHLVFALLSVSMLAYIMQFGMVSVSIGDLTNDLNAPLRWSGWVLTIFMVGQVVAMPVAGRLSERFGARTVFAGGFALFSIASLICALAPNVYVLIAARALQGAAGGGLQPSGTSLIGHVYGKSRMRAIGFYSSLMPFGAVLGPVVGGLIIDHFGWRWTFGFNAPLGLAVAVAAFALLPDAGRRPQVSRIDYRGIVLIALTIVSLIFALTELGREDAPADYRLIAASLAICAAALTLLVRHERRTPEPIIDLDLLSRKEFAATNVMFLSFGMAWIGVASMIPLYAQDAYDMSASQSGALLSPRAAVMVLASMIAAYFLPSTGFRKPILVGMVGVAASMFVIGMEIHEPSISGITIPDFWWMMFIVGTAGVFFGLANPSMTNAGIELAPDRIAAITGLRGMFMNLGGVLGISFVILFASRAGDTATGLNTAFMVLAAILLVTALVVRAIPEMGRTSQIVSSEAANRSREPAPADRA